MWLYQIPIQLSFQSCSVLAFLCALSLNSGVLPWIEKHISQTVLVGFF
jgi:hypothetical protein